LRDQDVVAFGAVDDEIRAGASADAKARVG